MIERNIVCDIVESYLANTDYYLVDVKISSDNSIQVEVDSFDGVTVDFCSNLSKEIENKLDREVEDYELTVSSAGLTSPFKVKKQYEKNIGNEVEIVLKDGKKLTGLLLIVEDAQIIIQQEKLVKLEGAKRKSCQKEEVVIPFNNIKTTKYIIRFK